MWVNSKELPEMCPAPVFRIYSKGIMMPHHSGKTYYNGDLALELLRFPDGTASLFVTRAKRVATELVDVLHGNEQYVFEYMASYYR